MPFQFYFSQQHVTLFAVSTIAFFIFLFHSSTIIGRHLKREILENHKVVNNQSLPMPIVQLNLESTRHPNSSYPFARMHFSAYFNEIPVPDWAHTNGSIQTKSWLLDYFMINVVDARNYDKVKAQSKWPLRTTYSTGARLFGYLIEGSVNATTYIERQENGDEDIITAVILSFGVDPADNTNTKGVPQYFQFRPCDEVAISINLKYSKLINRPESPCRNEYPLRLKKLVKNPLEPTDLYNSILAPTLPYDQAMCEKLCYTDYWLPKCDCLMSYDVWQYAGKPTNMTQCQIQFDSDNNSDNCTKDDVLTRTPANEFSKCECWKPCEGYSFEVTGYDKINYAFGNSYCPNRENSTVRLRVFYTALSYEMFIETEAYPVEEMINELAGIFGLYFGISLTSLAPVLYLAIRKLRRGNQRKNSMDLETAIKNEDKSELEVLQAAYKNLRSEHDSMVKKFLEHETIVKAILEKSKTSRSFEYTSAESHYPYVKF